MGHVGFVFKHGTSVPYWTRWQQITKIICTDGSGLFFFALLACLSGPDVPSNWGGPRPRILSGGSARSI